VGCTKTYYKADVYLGKESGDILVPRVKTQERSTAGQRQIKTTMEKFRN
jgi:hypothetical protein